METEPIDWREHVRQVGLGAMTGAIGPLIGNPVLAAAIGAVIPVYGIYRDFRLRQLSKREGAKLDAVAVMSLEFISRRLAAGEQLRNDGFFVETPDGQSPAKEVLEGVLTAVRDDHQDRKLPFYAELFANVVFTKDCTAEEANYLLSILDELTFRQLSTLRLIREKMTFDVYRGQIPQFHTTQWNLLSALNEIIDMFRMNLVMTIEPGANRPPFPEPSKMSLENTWLLQPGNRLFKMAGLKGITSADMEAVCKLFPPNLAEIALADREKAKRDEQETFRASRSNRTSS